MGNKMAAKAKSAGGTQRILQKLNKKIADGEYYEAHQLIRTLYFRFVFDVTAKESKVLSTNVLPFYYIYRSYFYRM